MNCPYENIHTSKQTLRKQMLINRRSFSSAKALEQTKLIHNQILHQSAWRSAKRIACYLALPGEISCHHLIEQAWKNGQTSCAPVIQTESNDMTFCDFEDFADLTPGPFGLSQPANGKFVSSEQIDLMLIPGIAFDRAGNRLGFGKGYYDRYLKNYSGLTLAMAYDWQLIDHVPTGDTDQPIQQIVTYDNYYTCC